MCIYIYISIPQFPIFFRMDATLIIRNFYASEMAGDFDFELLKVATASLISNTKNLRDKKRGRKAVGGFTFFQPLSSQTRKKN